MAFGQNVALQKNLRSAAVNRLLTTVRLISRKDFLLSAHKIPKTERRTPGKFDEISKLENSRESARQALLALFGGNLKIDSPPFRVVVFT